MRTAVLTVGAAVLLLAGCGSGAEPAPSSAAAPTTTSAAAAPAGPTPVVAGRAFTVASAAGVPQAQVTVRALERAPGCADGSTAGADVVAVHLAVAAAPTLDPAVLPDLTAADLAAGGAPLVAAGGACLADRPVLGALAPSAAADGWLAVSLPAPAYQLTLRPRLLGGAAWSVTVPAVRAPAPAPATTTPAAPEPEPTVELDADGCPPGTDFDAFADQCLTPAESAAVLQDEVDANAGPTVDSGPGCADRAMAAGVFNPDCLEYQGYLDPGGEGRAPTSAELMTEYSCQRGELTGPVCDPYT